MDALAQLQRLVGLRAKYWREINDNGQGMLTRAIFARFVDCCDAGLGQEAREALERLKGE